MNMAADPQAPLRQAALTLHALSDPDANWILAALPVEHRGALQPLLDELRALELPRDPGLLQCCRSEAPAARPSTSQRASPGLDAVPALVRVLRGEPPRLVARVLEAQPRHSRALLVSLLGAPVPGDALAPAPALEAALTRVLRRRVGTDPNDQADAGTTLWARLRRRLASQRRRP